MKPNRLPLLVLLVSLLPALAFAQAGKGKKKPAARPTVDAIPEALKPFDKNEDRQIDADELAAMQKTFAALRKIDKNSNGEIELAEVEIPKPPATDDRRARMIAGFQQVDKNGNRKIDGDEIEALQKALAGGRILSRLDQNGNGKLEPKEIERLNQRLAEGIVAGKRPGSAAAPTPSLRRPPEKSAEQAKPAETPKKEEKKDAPEAPAPEKKPPNNFGS